MFQHLVDCIDLHFAFLKTLEGEADGHVLSRLHQKRRVRVLCRNRGGQPLQQLLDVKLSIGISLGEFLLQLLGLHVGIAAHFSESGQQPDGLNDLFFLQGHDSARPNRPNGTVSGCSVATQGGNAAHRRAAGHTTAAIRALGSSNELQ